MIFKFATASPSCGGQVALPDMAGRDILILDDILDSGRTLAAIRDKLETAKPRSIRVCVLLSKRKQRARDVEPDYVGFEIEDEFVVGYGLDFMESYRNLPYIGVLRKELCSNRANELIRDHGQSFQPRRGAKNRKKKWLYRLRDFRPSSW